MSAHFKRQLADYVEYHRDPRNCALHVFGIVFLFLAAVLPLSLWPVHAFGMRITVATILVLPVLIYWLLLDIGVGTAILGAAFLLLSSAGLDHELRKCCRGLDNRRGLDRHRYKFSNRRPPGVRATTAGADG